MPTDYPCPICHSLVCGHWIGWTEDRRTVVPLAGCQAVDPPEVLETDILFHAGGMARVYRRLHSKGARSQESAARRRSRP